MSNNNSNNRIIRKRKAVQTVDDHTTVSYEWTDSISKEEYEAEKHAYMHPKLLQKYQKEAPELLEDRMSTAAEENEKRFWNLVKKSGAEVKREVTHLYRIKQGDKEYFFYGEELRSKDDLGNAIDHYHRVGTYEDPQFVYQLGPRGFEPCM
jgi:hypothetical protein